MSMSNKWVIFSVEGSPRGKGRPRFMRNGHTYTDDKTREYEERIKKAYLEVSKACSDKSIGIYITIAFAPNRTDTKAMRAAKLSNELMPRKKPDIDNVVKIVLDALNGVAYKDDTQVNEVTAIRKYDVVPYIQVEIKEIGELPKRRYRN